MKITVRLGTYADIARARKAYLAWGYGGSVADDDTLFLAERARELLGIVRRTREDGTVMLRGMYVAPEARRHGVGRTLLRALVSTLGEAECHCVPLAHLTNFYAEAGFEEIPETTAPAFLVERVARYRREGHTVCVMRRRPHTIQT